MKERIWDTPIKGSDWHKDRCEDKNEDSVDTIDKEKYYTQDDFAHHNKIWKEDDSLNLRDLLHWILISHPFHSMMEGMTLQRVTRLGVIFMNKFLRRFPAKNGKPTILKGLGVEAMHSCMEHFALYTEEEKLEIKRILVDEVWDYSKDL